MADLVAGARLDVDDLRLAVDDALAVAVESSDASIEPLRDAIAYSLLGPGKRVRPVLALAAAQAVSCVGRGEHRAEWVRAAAALEMVHAYSLVHDDLPDMDDDDLRRGRPTSHVRFGPATAILVGDALHALAFETLAASGIAPELVAETTLVLARAAGWHGMVGGQYLDIDLVRGADDIVALRDVHDRKTGALIAASVEIGAVVAGASAEERDAFVAFGRELGWLFQLVDDLLDATGDAATLGKTPGKDGRDAKVTAVDAFGGIEGLRSATDEQLTQCLDAAAELPSRGGRLPAIAAYVHGRDR